MNRGVILEANLTGAALLGVERSRLINRRLPHFVVPASQPIFLAFLERVFAGTAKQVCEAALSRENAAPFWAGFRATSAVSLKGTRKWCRVTFSDITARKQAEEAQRRMEVLAVANQELKREIVRRQAVEEALRKSEQHYARLLEQSRHMQEQMRSLSRQLLLAQEEERKRISRELHDVIAQTLTGINVQLATLKRACHSKPQRPRTKHHPHATVGAAVSGHRASVRPGAAPGGVGRPGADPRPPHVYESTSGPRRASGSVCQPLLRWSK